MKVELLHYTPHLHKLVEISARECYQSFSKLSPTSHKMLKGIMGKGHLSVASINSIVFGITLDHEDEALFTLDCLSVFKQINNFVRWTDTLHSDNVHSRFDYVVSMNILSLLDIHNNINDFNIITDLYDSILKEVSNVPEIYWFIDEETIIEPIDNPYKLTAQLGHPTILSEDYTALKDMLTEYELNIHAQIFLNFVYDRATSLQMHRHCDQLSTLELSQRYVDLTNALYRIPTDLEGNQYNLYNSYMHSEIKAYGELKEALKDKGKLRSQEIARNLLPNVLTNVIQARPLRQWKHLIKLRNSTHAQREVREDIQALIAKFEELEIPTK